MSARHTRRLCRVGVIILAFGLPMAAGCQKPLAPIFPEVRPPLVWPPPPNAPRISFIGELTGAESLKRPNTGWQDLGELLAGPTPKAKFVTPTSVAVRSDIIYVADADAQSVYRLNLNSREFTAIRSAEGAAFGRPVDLAVSELRLAVCDSARNAVFLFDFKGRYLSALSHGEMKRPCAVAWDSARREWWVLDSAAHACHVFDENGHYGRSIGSRGAGDVELNFPAGLTISPQFGAVIADSMNFRVQFLGTTTQPARAFGQKGDAAGDFALPRDVAVDTEGHVYVLDNQFENVQVFDSEGRLLMVFGEEGRRPGQFQLPAGITIDARNRIWIADTYNRRVQVFQYLAESPQ